MLRAFGLLMLFAGTLLSQTTIAPRGTQFFKLTPPPSAPLAELPPANGDDERDPAYPLYKEGYSLILDEKWSEAIKKLAEVKTKNPKSGYVDDAAYWSAYAQKRLDKKKGIVAYERFLEEFPESSYADDALADMSDHDVTVSVSGDAKNIRVKTPRPGAYSYSFGSTARASAQAMRDAERAMRDVEREMRRSGLRQPAAPQGAWSLLGSDNDEKKLDKKTRMKLAALRALAESETDEKAFAALKEVAIDRSQPRIMRTVAVEYLGNFHRFDVFPTLVEMAKNDPDDDVRQYAIYSIGDASKDKNKTVETLIVLFNATPKQKEKQLESILYVIADIGNDKAVDFLVKVANTHESDDLGSDAVYYLGNIGNEKSRAALLQILKGK